MFREYEQSIEMLLEISGMEKLLEDNPVSKSSIEIREKIVLPLVTIQQYCIQAMLTSGEENATLQKLILRTMFGIINAARNAA
jgi:phosphoenolpyruvate carboxylase